MFRIFRRSRRLQKKPFIFKLPLVVQQNVIQNLDFIDLIELASCSQKCADLIRNCRLPYDKMDIVHENKHKYIVIYKNGKIFFRWCFNASSAEKKRKKFREINGVKIKTEFLNNVMYSQSRTPELDMQNVIALFTNVFRIPVGKVTLYNRSSLSAIQGIGSCKEALVLKFYKRTPPDRSQQTISNEQLNCLMNNVKPSIDFQMTVLVEYGSRCDIGLDCDTILIHDSHWMTRTSLLSTRTAFLYLHRCNLTGRDFIEFVKQWMDSDDTKLQCVFSSGNNVLTGFKNHGLPIMPFDEKRRSRTHYCSKIHLFGVDFLDGWDIERKDGLLATIQFAGKCFRMTVWHDRFRRHCRDFNSTEISRRLLEI